MKFKISDGVLDNGFRFYCVQLPNFESVGISVNVGYGSIDEAANNRGYAHFVEHMLFKGTATKTWKNIKDIANETGGFQNAYTDFENTSYFIKVHKSNSGRALELISDIIKNSTMPYDEFKKEKYAVIGEIKMENDNPKDLASNRIASALYSQHPAKYPIIGGERYIKNAKREDLMRAYKTFYNPSNMTGVIYGGLSIDKSELLMKKYFEDFDRKRAKPIRHTSTGETSKRIRTSKKISESVIAIGYRARPFRPERLQENIATQLFSYMLSNKLMDEVRDKRGLSYYSYSNYTFDTTFSFIYALSNASKDPDTVEKVVMETCENMLDGKFEKSEFDRAQKGFINMIEMYKEDTIYSAIRIALLAAMDLKPEQSLDIDKYVKKLDMKSFNEAIEKIDRDYGLFTVSGKA